MKWQEDADGRAVLLRFAIALDADLPPVPLDELLCDKQSNSCADRSPRREEGVKTFGKSFGPIPTPLSSTVRTTPSPASEASLTEIERIPPLGMA